MAAASYSSSSEPVAAARFQFISVRDSKDRITRRLARSHAVKQALENKRKLQQESRDNFRVTTSKDRPRNLMTKKRTCTSSPTASLLSPLSAGTLDPFQTLAVDSSRLQTLLGNYKARQAPEPVFSVEEELAFQNFRSVFRTGLVDPALQNAVMLSFAFAVTGGSIDRECLGYQGQAISYIREKMSSLDEATSESTFGAILLLAGVEARLGMTSQVQLHMGAVRQLLDICRTKGVYLTGGIKRAIFWQDLNSSILAGCTRIVDHTTFAELQWTRDPFSPHFFRLPPGFQTQAHLLSKEFVEVLEDVHALKCIRDIPHTTKSDVSLMAHINNHTASIQSRLSHVSSKLLRELQRASNDPVWDDHHDLLLWLLYIGGAFAPIGVVRSGYVALLRANNATRFKDLYSSWSELVEILKQFIWSEDAFKSQVKALWEETSS
ncbi:hypothetical protein UA08_00716 [Talaromyces atroroseus]|uniref:Transcription factor domain-containing protein n=1 Tax=Talaromyces atroroseus TaxID=1441469 RepID=A0A225B8G8_TALAT|nr:hypothetical protein UA08_00716 [Talaromyces atroroseus]OKL63696.1 hypothetical protein UA08_00716 [Talaromyces atroroseus]